MVALDVLSFEIPLLVEGFLEDFSTEGPVHVTFGVTVAFTLLAGTLLLGYSPTFARSTASRVHNEPALALWYGVVVWVAAVVVTIVVGAAGPPVAYLGALLWVAVEMVGYATAAIALGQFVLRGPLEDERAGSDGRTDEGDAETDESHTLPIQGFEGVLGGEPSPWLALVVGAIPIALLVIVPVVGWVLTFLVSGFGVGAIALEYLEYEEPTPVLAEG